MDLVQAAFLGILQGIAEWLPVSSQGQVIVAAMHLLGITEELAFRYAVFLHVGTLIAAIVYFRRDLVEIAGMKDRRMLWFLGLGLIGSALTAAPAYLLIKQVLQAPFALMLVIGVALLLTGFLQFGKRAGQEFAGKKAGFLTGLAQGFSVVPGISRSGVTTAALLVQGFSPEKAFSLSFILSIPSVLLAEIAFGLVEGISFEANALAAVAVAALVGFVSIDFLLKLARRINFGWFAIGFGLLYLAIAFV